VPFSLQSVSDLGLWSVDRRKRVKESYRRTIFLVIESEFSIELLTFQIGSHVR